MKPKQKFKRYCNRCDRLFTPNGDHGVICQDCSMAPGSKNVLKARYFKSKEELDIIRSDTTLAKWKVLSVAYKLGKKIWGNNFTKQRLAFDMDVPLTTTLRCLSLDKANNKSLKLMKSGKITAFKLAMVCQLKSKTYQDEIVAAVISDNISTYQIKTLKIDNIKDINKERHRIATESGYSRQSSAAANFENWISRGKLFLLMRQEFLPDNKKDEIKNQLKKLNEMIDRYIS